ncbi:LysM domain protein [Beauveria brongniartii RCEF 3172]|uniref:LysM domain protein n=1 Tax=Beauveria brongniartii RCEF 3172 TaxID=1081107 RepID=A0A166WNL9_9HYPO|nr:LysM domain protein [Beauveria brongniartii RCEF 3172]
MRRADGWDGSDWMADQDHSLSQQPFHSEKGYKVWRNVKDYGAVGDGVTDDTDAIQKAISDGNRCGKGCPESSVSGAIVYFPSVGAVKGRVPTIQSARNFIGLGVFTTDVYLPDGHSEWYLNTSNFYRSIRGLQIDIRLTRQKGMVGIHWQVAQATAIEETGILMSNASSTTQIGIFAENGSGGWMGDITISDGEYGILAGSQQYSASRINIIGSQKCIGLIWNWVWSWSHLRLEGCKIAIDLTAAGSDSKSPVGSLSVVDSAIIHCNTAIKTYPFTLTQSKEQGSTIITLSHSQIYKSTTFIGFPDGASISKNVDDWKIDYWQYGNNFKQGDVAHGESTPAEDRPASLLDSNGNWFSTGKPTFYNRNKDQVVNARLHAAGDGKTDDTVALQSLFQYAAENNLLLYIPAGVYIISSPLLIPSNTRIRGEVWSQLMAVGDKFADAQRPKAMITVGQGEKNGLVQLENLLFTSRGSLPGLALLQWNLQSTKQGDVGMWDCHFRVGGATGTDLRKADCPKLSGSVNSKCIAGAIMLVKTNKGSGYFENMWAWVADHDLDDPAGDDSNQINVYFARGILIFGDGPTWWRGTASEHSVMYQYNIASASNVYMSIIQTESPYYQGTSFLQAPAPFKPGNWIGEPSFDQCGSATTNCNVAWALIVQHSNGIYIDGTGLYSWFQNYNQDCVGKKTCQQRLVNIYNSANVFISHLITIGSVEVVTPAFSNDYNRIIYVDDTLEATVYPWWTAMASYLDSSAKINITGHDYPIKKGWVAFGDSYAAGIGAGTPLDADPNCYRGRGSYTAILDNIIQTSHHASIVWQSRSCSGETAEQFIKGEGAKQLERWQPSFSDIATVSFTGNDFGFGDIVSHCLMGYPRGSQNQQCEEDLATTRRKLDTEHKVQDLVYNVLDEIYNKKSGHGRLMVYWTGYPQFFDATDKTCDSAYFSNYLIWAGRYLEAKLRLKLNEFSVELNQQVKFAIRRYNQFEPSPKAKFVDIDADSGIYTGHRFCEPGVKETLNTEQGQNTVAFFYPDGWDDIPSADEHFYMPPKKESQAPDKWSVSVQSSTCNDTEDSNEPLRPMLCSAAKAVANGTLTTSDIDHAAGEGGSSAVKNSDGSVTITDFSVAYLKMFHPKTRANWRIAQAVHDVMILHLN